MRSGVVKVGVLALRCWGGCERGGRLQSCLAEEALRERRQTSVGEVELDALNTVHGKENDGRGEGFAVPHHDGEILKGGQFGSAQAETLRRKREYHSPELLPRAAEGCDHECAGDERSVRHGRGWNGAGGIFFHSKIVAGRRGAWQLHPDELQ